MPPKKTVFMPDVLGIIKNSDEVEFVFKNGEHVRYENPSSYTRFHEEIMSRYIVMHIDNNGKPTGARYLSDDINNMVTTVRIPITTSADGTTIGFSEYVYTYNVLNGIPQLAGITMDL